MSEVKSLRKNHVIVIKTVNSDMTSYRGFRWKKRGFVKCDDWEPTKKCGNGLHGLLWGRGTGTPLEWSADAIWLCLSVDKRKIVHLKGKVKFPECWVLKAGKRKDVLTYASKHGLDLKNCVGGWSSSSGDHSESSSFGIRSKSSSYGRYSKSNSSGIYSESNSSGSNSKSSSSGRYSKSSSFGIRSESSSSDSNSKSRSSGDHSESNSLGDYSKSSSYGHYSESSSFGNHSESNSSGTESSSNSSGRFSKSSSSGIGSTSISSGYSSKSKSFDDYSKSVSIGDNSISSSDGNHSKSCSIGDHCMSTARGKRTISMVNGLNGKASAGPKGVFALPWIDKNGELQIAIGKVGKNGIKPDVMYEVDQEGKLIKANEREGKLES